MNCPSRTDEVDLNPGWNQNPPFLAADLTTCQDLNGMINSRALKRDNSAGSHPSDDALDEDYRTRLTNPRSESLPSTATGWAWWILSVLCTSVIISNVHIFNFSNIPPLFEVFKRGAMGESRPLNADHL